ncbi:sodium/proton antiporter NhaB [Succinivibrio sp.]|uniref:sodium/proton antiporter NhaB n=1 Tax=Succinivibrio sp. TaxID=2053619 RepID=UPI00386A1B78
MSTSISYAKAGMLNFLGSCPVWYKNVIIACLIINPIVAQYSMFVAGWLLVAEFIFTLSMALDCYPLEAGGLLVIEACFLGMCDMHHVTKEIESNLEVIMLLMFMVAGIHFVRDFLLFFFTKLLVKVRSNVKLAFLFCFMSGLLSAFVDALTVLAIIISTCVGLYQLYMSIITNNSAMALVSDSNIPEEHKKSLEEFRAFLRSLLMHSAVGTTIGGVCTIVGEPQNLIIGDTCGWKFIDYALRMAPISLPVLVFGLFTCFFIEKFKLFGYGHRMPDAVYQILVNKDKEQSANLTKRDKLNLIIQCCCIIWLVVALGFHLASVGVIGLSVIVLATALCGVTSEGPVGKAFCESMPFCALLCVFFTVVTVISTQKLFDPIIQWVFSTPEQFHLPIFYMANGIISSVSDNVFVATIYIQQVRDALIASQITPEQFDEIAIAINAGTNLPSVATPNGQAAFLFLLTSPIAALIKLPYLRMMYMAIPYTIVLTIIGLIATWFIMPIATGYMISEGLVHGASIETILGQMK